MKIVVIIPTYNEKANMESMIPLLVKEVFPKINNHEMAILVADDHSPDGTRHVIEKFMKEYKNVHLLEGERQGLGRAYVRAMRYAMDEMHADAVIEFDADFQHDAHDIPRFVQAMDDGADYVIGSRYIKGGEIPKEWGFDRKLKSRLGGLFAKYMFLMFSIHDMTSGYKLTKSRFLKKVDLEHLYSFNYAYKLHILHDVVRMGAKVKEIPIIFYERTEGKSKMDTNDMVESLLVVIRLTLQDFKRVIKFLIVGGTGFIVQLIMQEFSARVLNLPEQVAVGIGAESAILSNFMLNHFWTFQDASQIKQSAGFFRKLVKFNISSLMSIFLQVFFVSLAIHTIGTDISFFDMTLKTRIIVLFPTIILLVIPLNYLIYNKIIWKTQYLKKDGQT